MLTTNDLNIGSNICNIREGQSAAVTEMFPPYRRIAQLMLKKELDRG